MLERAMQDEKKIQNWITDRLSQKGYKYDIIDETNRDLEFNHDHKYLIINNYGENLQGLKFFIKKHNKKLYEEYKNSYAEDELTEILLNDFISRYNKAKDNTDYYNMVFTPNFLTIDLKNEKNKTRTRSYAVISFDNSNDNNFTIIREKRLEGNKGIERPDFAMYINGIPLIVSEVKTAITTIDKAFREYTLKSTYNKFILCLGTDGNDVFLTGSKKYYFKWKKYGDNKDRDITKEIIQFLDIKEHKLSDIENISKTISNCLSSEDKAKIKNIISKYVNKENTIDVDIVPHLINISKNSYDSKHLFISELKTALYKDESGLEDIISELFDKPSNLLFYFRYCVFTDIDKNDGNCYLINHRVQQYYTVLKFDKKLQRIKINRNNFKPFQQLLNELVVHVQRSGKSITIRACVNLLFSRYSDLFRKVYICVPDLTILNVMLKTFRHNKVQVKQIRTRKDYVKSIHDTNSGFTLYLYNIQKTKDEECQILSNNNVITKNKYKANDVLFIIDEVHFSQNKLQSDIRRSNFPYASFLSFTATPKIKEKSNSKINYTASLYADADKDGQIHYLDELIYEEAVTMGIILPVIYEKLRYQQIADLESATVIDEKIHELVIEKLNSDEYRIKIETEQDEAEQNLRDRLQHKINENKISKEKLDIDISKVRQQVFKTYYNSFLKVVEKVENEKLLNNLILRKLNFITDDMNNKRQKCYSDNNGLSFKTKAFITVNSKEDAYNLIKAVQQNSENNDNTYKGYRFGVDFSEQQTSVSDIDLLENLNRLNPGEKVIKYFESQKDDNDRVDILIIVNKYLMGYDNPELVCVYCDRTISEPAKLYQLITRSATTRKDKKQGFFVDLTFSEDNYKTYLTKCLPYYNNSGSKISTLTEEEIKIEKNKLQTCLNNIKYILDIPEDEKLIDEVKIYNRLLSIGENKSPSEVISRKNRYFNEFRDINEVLAALINPKYYLENFDEIIILSKVNMQYLRENMPKHRDNDIIFDRSEIESIILKSIKFFGFSDLEEINSFKIEKSIIKDQATQSKIDFNNVISEFKQNITLARYPIPLGITEMINKWSDQIKSAADATIAINNFTNEFIKPFKDKQKAKQERINKEFDGSIAHYMAYDKINQIYAIIEEKISLQDFKDDNLNNSLSLSNNDYLNYFDIFAKTFSKLIQVEVNELMNEESTLYLKNKEYYLEKLMRIKVITLVDVFDSICKEIKDVNFINNFKKAFWNDLKRLKEILESPNELLSEDMYNFVHGTENIDIQKLFILCFLEDYYLELKNKTIN